MVEASQLLPVMPEKYDLHAEKYSALVIPRGRHFAD